MNSRLWEKLGPQARPANFAFPLEVFHSTGFLTWKVDTRTPRFYTQVPVQKAVSTYRLTITLYY